jgi:hypothetical protein
MSFTRLPITKAFAVEKVIRICKAVRLTIMASLNNVLRHSCQIEPQSSWYRGEQFISFIATPKSVV